MNKNKLLAGIGLLFIIFGSLYIFYLYGEEMLIEQVYDSGVNYEWCLNSSTNILDSDLIQSSVDVPESVIRLGDQISATITIKNNANEAIRLEPQNQNDQDGLWVLSENSSKSIVLEPGKEKEITWTLTAQNTGRGYFHPEITTLILGHSENALTCKFAWGEVFVVNTFGLTIKLAKIISVGTFLLGLLAFFYSTSKLRKQVTERFKEWLGEWKSNLKSLNAFDSQVGIRNAVLIGAIAGYASIIVFIMGLQLIILGLYLPLILIDIVISIVGIPFGVTGSLIGRSWFKTSKAAWIGGFILTGLVILVFWMTGGIYGLCSILGGC